METPPGAPRQAWESDEDSNGSTSSLEACEESPVLLLKPHASWLPVYELEQDKVDLIEAFDNTAAVSEQEKVEFLRSICLLLYTARRRGLKQGLDTFCKNNQLVQTIQAILQEQPVTEVHTDVWHLAMEAIVELSSVQPGLEDLGTSFAEICCMSIFFLPPEEEFSEVETFYYEHALEAMDGMFKSLVVNSADPEAGEELKSILQLLLCFSCNPSSTVRNRALGRIKALSRVLRLRHYTLKKPFLAQGSHFSRLDPEQLLGQLLGQFLLFRFSEDGTSNTALDVLRNIYKYLMHHRERRKQKQVEERRLELDASPRVLTMKFAVLLFPRERMEMVCVLIEAMKDSSIFDKRVAENILELVLRDPEFWLLEIPSVVRSIHECLRNSSIEEMWRMDELITLMAIKYPRELIVTMVLNVPLRESSDLVMWDMVLSISEPIETLQELLGMIEPRASDAGGAEGPQGVVTVAALMEKLLRLSKECRLARKLQQLLPHILGRLWDVTEKLQIKGLLILQNVMKHLSREEASPIAVGLVQDLRPFFDAGCERLRALSIRLVCFLLEMMLGCDWRRIRSKTWDLLLPVFFHLNDKSHSVVKASRKALLAVATLLGWEDLQHLLETKQMWRVMECLVKRSRKRMQACLHHSLQYLRDAQVPLREAAVRFIALEVLLEEADPELRSLTAQTLLILRSAPEQQNLGCCTLWALWCWERRSFP
ncbi:uncharacterized protein [Melopsittacus undulatus]|uniref:uncharacterized protein n=1 Tax=Melopsittacus undulatus TaxID=13146 RepID=UPI00146BBBCF|nr:uncharacterized protein LOC117438581 [Melopsittacus undulatus]